MTIDAVPPDDSSAARDTSNREPFPESSSDSTHIARSDELREHLPEPEFGNGTEATEIHLPGSSSLAAVPEEDQPTVISEPNQSDDIAKRHRRPSDAAVELLGVMLDHYRLDEYIGGGGMGAVFKAHDTLLGRTVAVKILSRGGGEQELLKRFVNEAQSAAKLDHDNIARVFFVGQALGWNYIVFEYVEGKNIRQIVADRGPMELPLAMRYICQITRALEHAGGRQVIHRDIKPSNVIATPDHRIKLVDMGLARMGRLDRDQEDLTASGMTLGTFDYISPEQARDPRSADTRSDIYSLGCTFFFMLTGLPPFPDGTPLQKLLSHQEAERPNPKAFRPDLPDEIVTIVRKQLAPNPSQRYQTANELLADLLIAASHLGIDVGLKESLIIEPVEVSRSWLNWIAPLAIPAATLALLILVAELLLPVTTESLDDFSPTYSNVAAAIDESIPLQPSERNNSGMVLPDEPDDSDPVDDGTSPLDSPAGSAAGQNSASRANDSNTTDAAAPRAETTVVKVGLELTPEDGVEIVASVEAAIALANINSSVEEIQLCFDGFQTTQALEIQSQRLRLLAGVGYRPGLRFSAGTGRMSSPHLIRIYCEEFEIRGIDFELTLSGDGSYRQVSWLHIEQNYGLRNPDLRDAPLQDFDFVDCRFTVNESPSSDVSELPSVSVVHINRPQDFFLRLPSVDVAQRPNLLLRRTLVRGKCHLIRAAPATPFYMLWEQSAFVSPKVACQFAGVSESDEIAFDPLNTLNSSRLELRSVTTICPGLVEVRVSSPDPEPLRFVLDVRRSWIALPEDEAMIHHRLLNDSVVDDALFTVDGQENLYAQDSLLWQLDIAGQVDRIVTLDNGPLSSDWFLQQMNLRYASMPSTWSEILAEQRPAEAFSIAQLIEGIESVSTEGNRKIGADPNELASLESTPADLAVDEN